MRSRTPGAAYIVAALIGAVSASVLAVGAETVSFVEPYANVDNTAGWSVGDATVNLGVTQFSILGGVGLAQGERAGSPATISQRGTRGLGVWGGSDSDEIDAQSGNQERITLAFDHVVRVNWVEIRSLFIEPGQVIDDTEYGRIEFSKAGIVVHTEDLAGAESPGALGSVTASFSTPVSADQIEFFVPTGQPWSAGSEFAVAQIDVTLFQPVTVDIKPGSDPNSINLGENGVLPVAVLGSADFDVLEIDAETVALGGVAVTTRGPAKAPKLACSYEDANGDGYTDLAAFFSVQELVAIGALTESTTELNLTGNLTDGLPISGMDFVRPVPPQ